jgi:Transposase DDE domain
MMSTTAKSPKRVLAVAYAIGRAALRPYAHRYSPQKFTQPQLFAGLVLKEFLRLDYRKLAALLRDCGELAATIELTTIPHFTTFQKAADRLLLIAPVRRLLDESLARARLLGKLGRRSPLAALDGTGFEAHHVSHYFVRRRANNGKTRHETTYRRFPKAAVLCDCRTHLVLAIVPGRGPAPDIPHFRTALSEALSRIAITTLVADAGYDAEHIHEYARHERGVNTIIPALIGRPTAKRPKGFWRRRMASRLHLTRYSQRWQVETVNSMLKRLLGSALRARRPRSQHRELYLRALTLNVMILKRHRLFYRAFASPFST